MLDEQSQHVAYVIEHGLQNDARSVEPTQAAEDEWVATIHRLRANNQAFLEACTPGYYNNEGQPGVGNSLADGMYGGGPEAAQCHDAEHSYSPNGRSTRTCAR